MRGGAKTIRILIDMEHTLTMNPMETAPLDGTPVLLKFHDDLSKQGILGVRRWEGLMFVGRNQGGISEWGFAAPVGTGGFPAAWFQGWYDIQGL